MRFKLLAMILAFSPAVSAWGYTTSTVTYQQGVNNYNDGYQLRISGNTNAGAEASDGVEGHTVQSYFVDGFQTDDPVTPAIEAYSADEQDLIRFSNIFGTGAAYPQIPLGATILDASLTHTTATVSNAQSPGAFGVAALLQPFTSATRYGTDFPSNNSNPLIKNSHGAWFQDGADQAIGHPYATRPQGAFAGPNSAVGEVPITGTNNVGGVTSADVRPIVQMWSSDPAGTNNYGMVIQAGFTGQTNGWAYWTNGNTTPAVRPKLSVTYTTDPIGVTSFQRGVNGYSSDAMVRLSSGVDLVNSSDDITLDSSTLTGSYYIDEMESSTANHLRTVLKFGDVFGAGAGQAPLDKAVAKAWVVVTTGTSDDNRSPGPFSIHKMLRDWDTTTQTQYSTFGTVPGLQEADGDLGPALDLVYGSINGQQTWFEVTSYLEARRTAAPGTPDYGLAIIPQTNDGWALLQNGNTDETVRPRLVVYSDLSAAPAGVLGDYNNNGVVDGADYVVWRKGGALQNESASPGVNAPDDYTYWRSRFGKTDNSPGVGSGGAVPEPTACLLGLIAATAISFTSNRNRQS